VIFLVVFEIAVEDKKYQKDNDTVLSNPGKMVVVVMHIGSPSLAEG